MLDFDAVQAALEGLGANLDAAEAHGTLCALLLKDNDFPIWIGHCVDDLPNSGDVLAAERIALLEALFAETREQLDNDELGFQLLLPDEDDDFGLRLLACRAGARDIFMVSGCSARSVEAGLDEDAREGLSDLLEISKLSHDAEASEDAQQQFIEIAEHVRIVALLLNESINVSQQTPTLH